TDGANDRGFFQTGDDTFRDGLDGSHAQWLPDQAAFAAEVTRFASLRSGAITLIWAWPFWE
ncbi:MAG: hypothetical protein WAL39_22895, partial [Xanthobacteraceae bacterium]